MKKEIIISTIVLAIIIIADLVSSNFTDNKIKDIDNDLIKVQKMLENEKEIIDVDLLKEDVDKIKEEWNKDEETFSYYIEHQELEKVGTEMDSLNCYVKNKNKIESLNCISRIRSYLSYISNKHDFKLNNFF